MPNYTERNLNKDSSIILFQQCLLPLFNFLPKETKDDDSNNDDDYCDNDDDERQIVNMMIVVRPGGERQIFWGFYWKG